MAVGARSPSASEQRRGRGRACAGGGCGTAVAAVRLRNSSSGSSLPFPWGPAAAMGSRASTLLRDEEIEEIKKETGCECRGLSAAGRGGKRRGIGGRSGAARSPSGRGGGGPCPARPRRSHRASAWFQPPAAPGPDVSGRPAETWERASQFPPAAAGSSSEIPGG